MTVNILVIGGTRFIGAHVVRRLHDAGAEVTARTKRLVLVERFWQRFCQDRDAPMRRWRDASSRTTRQASLAPDAAGSSFCRSRTQMACFQRSIVRRITPRHRFSLERQS
ncbi:MAG: NAD(P)-dependent oxidoreductase [Rhizobiales bacterium]|nr:NAD(P)-dependent oxidoreductase [Hyphomicrobiales bacterium]